jgi:molecular chaperone HscB
MDPFATLGVERSFEVDLKAVEKTHRDLSRALHPDRYAGSGASERRLALNRAVEVNEAWRIMRDPIRRAESLFELAGIAVGEASEPKPSGAFLMDMMEQREALDLARTSRDRGAVLRLARDVEARGAATEATLAHGFRNGADEVALLQMVGKLGELRFYRRFLQEVSEMEEELTHGTA